MSYVRHNAWYLPDSISIFSKLKKQHWYVCRICPLGSLPATPNNWNSQYFTAHC